MASSQYIPSPALSAVVDLALDLEMPLLLTGEPGTGKTRLAYYVAEQLGISTGPLIFNTKTDAQARDLFYSYDAIGHFRDAGIPGNQVKVMDYISFNALGQALLQAGTQRAVVLIDEIDKAPRDFSNDLLYEFDQFAFRIKEADAKEVQASLGSQAEVDAQGFIRPSKGAQRPILILTSNSEKNLPDAFLRRVLYHHIDFPDGALLQAIIEANAPSDVSLDQRLVEAAIAHFLDIRAHKRLRKAPATAELLAWVHVLHRKELDLRAALKASGDRALKTEILNSYALIAKNKEDLETLRRDLGL